MGKTQLRKFIWAILSVSILVIITGGYGKKTYAATMTGDAGDNIQYDLSGNVLTLTGSGDMYTKASWNMPSAVPWSDYASEITQIDIDEGITSISNYAFMGCNITSITIPDSVTKIGVGAFSGCLSIKDLTMPISATIGNGAFNNCKNIETINITEGSTDAKGVDYDSTTYKYTPWYVSMEKEPQITLSDKIVKIGSYSFYDDSEDYDYDIQDCNFIEATDIVIGEKAFCGGSLPEKILFDNATTLTVEKNAFKDVDRLSEISVPISSVFDSDAFDGCSAISTIAIKTGNGEGTDYTSDTYKYTPWYAASIYDNTLSLTFDSGIRKIGAYTFFGSSSISSFTVSDDVEEIGSFAFSECRKLTSFTFPNNATYERIETGLFDGCEKLSSISGMPSTINYIGPFAFRNCSSLDAFCFPENVTQINKNTFFGCTKLKEKVEAKAKPLTYEKVNTYHRWYLESDFSGDEYMLEENLTTVTENKALFLLNTDLPPVLVTHTYVVKFNSNGGTAIPNQTITVTEGIPIPALVTKPTDPTKESHDFKGWFKDVECSDEWDFATDEVDSDMMLYAKWECLHEKTVLVAITGQEPTCGDDGLGRRYCYYCKKLMSIDTEVMPKFGDHNFILTLVKSPTYEEDGLKINICSRCGETDETVFEVIPKLVPIEPVVQDKDNPNKYTVNLVKGGYVNIPALKLFSSYKKWKIEFSELGISSLSREGRVNGLKRGNTVLTLTTNTTKDPEKEEVYIVDIEVKEPDFPKYDYRINTGETIDLGFGSIGDNTGLAKEFTTSRAAVATVNTLGQVTGVSYGSVTITVKVSGRAYKTCRVYVEDGKISDTTLMLINGKNKKLKVTGTKLAPKWTSDNDMIARVSNGRVYPVSTGKTVVHADVNGRDLQCVVVVDKPVISEKEHSLTIGVNDSFVVEMTQTDYPTGIWNSSNTKVATVDTDGKVTAKKAGKAAIRCRINDVIFKCIVTVYDPYISGKSKVKIGKRIKMKLKNGGKDAVWSVDNIEGEASIDQKGNVRGVKSGAVVIKCTTVGKTVTKTITVK